MLVSLLREVFFVLFIIFISTEPDTSNKKMLKATRHPERQPPLFITKLVVSVQYCYFVVLAMEVMITISIINS